MEVESRAPTDINETEERGCRSNKKVSRKTKMEDKRFEDGMKGDEGDRDGMKRLRGLEKKAMKEIKMK